MRNFLRKNLILFLSLAAAITIVSGCDDNESMTAPQEETTVMENPFPEPPELPFAREYMVLGEQGLGIDDFDRSVGRWVIVSENATSFEERAQTVLRATIDLYQQYQRDYTVVSMAVTEDSWPLMYAWAHFSADGLGPAGLTGSAPANPSFWRITAVSHTYTEIQLAISKLWWDSVDKFPNPNLVSSCSYDEKALRQYIAKTLDIDFDEIVTTDITLEDYDLPAQVTEWTSKASAYHQNIPAPVVSVTPQPGHRLENDDGEKIGVIVGNVRAEAGICDKDYPPPIWASYIGMRAGDPCIIVTGTVTNLDSDKPEIKLRAKGYDANGHIVSTSQDTEITPTSTDEGTFIFFPESDEYGIVTLHLDGNESSEFSLHLLPSEVLTEIRIFATVSELP